MSFEEAQEVISDRSTLEDALSTPEFKQKAAQPDVHHGVITGVTLRHLDNGGAMIDVGLRSLDVGFDENYNIYVPSEWVDDPYVSPDNVRNELTPDEINAGKKMTPAQIIAASVKNSEGTGRIQQLIAIAKEEGRLSSATSRPTNSGEYVDVLNSALSGINVVFTRRPDSGNADPAFRNRLRVSQVFPYSSLSDPAFLTRLTKKGRYALAWEA